MPSLVKGYLGQVRRSYIKGQKMLPSWALQWDVPLTSEMFERSISGIQLRNVTRGVYKAYADHFDLKKKPY